MNLNLNEKNNFMMYFFCQLVSNLGSIMQISVTPLFILDMTGSGSKMGYISSTVLLCTLITSFFAGSLADNKNQKNILVITDFINGTTLLLYLLFGDSKNISLFFLLMVAQGITSSFFNSANNALFSRISPNLEIGKKTSFMSIGSNSINILGPIIGIFVYTQFGIKYILFFNMLSFLISGFFEIFIDVKEISQIKEKDKTSYKTVLTYLNENSVLKDIISLTLILNFLLAPLFGIVLIYFIKEQVKLPNEYIGYLQSLTTVGLLLGSIIVFKYGEKFKLKEKYLFFIPLQSLTLLLFYFLMGQSRNFPIVGLISVFVVGIITLFIINSLILIPTNILLHEKVDNKIKGKFFAIFMGAKQSLIPISISVFGAILGKIDIVLLVTVLVCSTLTFQFYFIKQKKLYSRYLEYIS